MRHISIAISLAFLTLLSSCGGGGSGTASGFEKPVLHAGVVVVPVANIFPGSRASYTLTKTASGYNVTDKNGIQPAVTVSSTARLRFSDTSLALDVEGIAGQAYRIYKAAFNRTPDASGLGYWMGQMDKGMPLNIVADAFFGSAEFKSLYGPNPSNIEILNKYYQNVLGRLGDAGGTAFWQGVLDGKFDTPAGVLASFSESPENKAAVATAIQNGIVFAEFGISYTSPVVTAPTQTFTSYSPTSAKANQLTTFTFQGTGLTSGLSVVIPGCTGMTEIAGGTSTLRSFSCTPTALGSFNGQIFDTPGGKLLAGFAVTVSAQMVPTVQISFSPASIIVGQTSTLTWSSSNATSCSSTGIFSGPASLSGTTTYTPASIGSFSVTLTCVGADGTTSSTASVVATAVTSAIALNLWGDINNSVFLGCLNCGQFDSTSVCNNFGTYGSNFGSYSIWNQFGNYGSQFSTYSPWNAFTSSPPAIFGSDGKFYGYFTINSFQTNRTTFPTLLAILNSNAATHNLSATKILACGA